MNRKVSVVLLILGLLIFTPALVTAESFTDLFFGMSFSEDDDVNFSVENDAEDISVQEDQNVDGAYIIGYRIGHYFDDVPWLGIAAEISYFSPDPDAESYDDLDLSVYPISALLMLRIPLMKSSDYQYGRYQPYTGIGPSAFISSIEIGDYDDTSVDIGLDARAGFSMFFKYNFAVFVEYRYTTFDVEFDDIYEGTHYEIDGTLETHHALVGLSYHF